MHTPAHIAASLLVWRKEPGWRAAVAVTIGALLPDLPMFGFYVYQKTVGSTESEIWNTLYFEAHWQLFFDTFNSVPFAMVAIAICVFAKQPLGVLVAASAILHMACDLPLHHDDAHRHFLPLNWRFQSPISYWDPAHYGLFVAAIELLFALAASLYVAMQAPYKSMRMVARMNLALYLLVPTVVFLIFLTS